MPRINGGTKTATPVKPTGPVRNNLKPWDTFRAVFKDGKVGKKEYIHLGSNGKYWSLNVGNGELAYARNSGKAIKQTGHATVDTKMLSVGQQARKRRDAVKDNEVFRVQDGGSLYAHLGRLNDGTFMAVNLSSQDYAVADPDRGDKNVTVVGTYEVNISRKGF